jgi:hypothetical protein
MQKVTHGAISITSKYSGYEAPDAVESVETKNWQIEPSVA